MTPRGASGTDLLWRAMLNTVARNVGWVAAAWVLSLLGACAGGSAGDCDEAGAGAGAATAPSDHAPAAAPSCNTVPIMIAHDESIFPELWRKPPISARAEPLDEARGLHARGVIEAAMRKYPAGVLEGHVKGVYLVGRLHYSGIVAGGTNSSSRVYVAVGDVKRGYTDTNIEQLFHAEVSSILLRNRSKDFDEAAWRAVNPPGFTYLGHGTEAIRQGKTGQRGRSDLLDAGFLGEYSKSTLENDFNAFACLLFAGDPEVWESASGHPAILAKRRLAIEFFQRLNPALIEAYFQSLRR